ncbi:MAG: S46 family peptidase [Breznakibacter sp.]
MIKRFSGLILAFVIGFGQLAKADEGMWLLPLIAKLNIGKMQEMGFKLTAEDIYSINQSSLKDAVAIFGRGCTSEVISAQGLVLTNHHCGYSNIQALSSVEHNYLEDGFWAKSLAEELPAPGLTMTFLKRMDDVTDKITEGVTPQMSEKERKQKIDANGAALTKEAINGTHYTAIVRSYFGGNQYFLVVYETFNDIRLVGTPPSSIGKFGHDTDNWMWPRHTGDFSMFRIYCGPDGKPALYSEKNVPYKPTHHLPVSLKGTQIGDFAMTIGFPGSTDRYLTSFGIDERMNITNRSRIEPREIKQNIWLRHMQASEKVNIQYAAKYSQSSNYWKNSIGMNRGLTNLNIPAKKRELEAQFAKWTTNGGSDVQKYAGVLPSLQKAYAERAPYMLAYSFAVECMVRGTELFYFATSAKELQSALASNNTDDIAKAKEKLQAAAKAFYKDYDAAADKEVMAALLEFYANSIDQQWHPTFMGFIQKKFKNNYAKYADYVFAKSVFSTEEKLNAFLNKPSLNVLTIDPAFEAGMETMALLDRLRLAMDAANDDIELNVRLFQAGLMQMQPEKTFYPDANFTMRLSYGKVGNYSPKDAVVYKHFTTLKGVMEKEDPSNWEFVVPAKLKELYQNADYGQYADADGTLHVCFTTDNDITGGNSGSPVINANGELFGLAFDGNWEAMSGDMAFESELQKCINVDIRYVLFIVDKFAGAQNLIDEMTIVK